MLTASCAARQISALISAEMRGKTLLATRIAQVQGNVMSEQKTITTVETAKQDLHAPLRPLGIKAVVAAALMLKRKTLKPA